MKLKILLIVVLCFIFDVPQAKSATLHGYDSSKVTTTCPNIPNSGVISISPTNTGALSSAGTNAKFVFEPGTYTGLKITPKNGQEFYAKSGVYLNGNGQSHAFYGNGQNIYICGFNIYGYKGPYQQAAINGQAGDAGGSGRTQQEKDNILGDFWEIENVKIYDNYMAGVMLGSDSVIRNSEISNNNVVGLKATAADGAVFDNVKVEHNGYDNPFPSWGHEGGGSKFARATRLVVKNSYFVDNKGPGIWTDIDNYQILYEGNLVENNMVMGIFHEISYDAIIRNNVVINNGKRLGCGWSIRCAGIYISSSEGYNGKDIEIYNNYVYDNLHGIMGTSDSRRGLADMDVHNNVVVNSGSSGAAAGGGGAVGWDTINFDHNCYENSGGFEFQGSKDWNGWRATGQDINGQFNPTGGCPEIDIALPSPTTSVSQLPSPTPTSTPALSPTSGVISSHNIPGKVEAEDYKDGGEGVGYHDNSQGNSGDGNCRFDNVDLKQDATNCIIGWFDEGEWLAYDLNVTQAGKYSLKMRVAQNTTEAVGFKIYIDGLAVTEVLAVESTGDWSNLVEATFGEIDLTAGEHEIRIENAQGFFDLDWFELSLNENTEETPCQKADINSDNTVDLTDYSILVANFFSNSTQGDINSDGVVDISDYSLFVSNFFNQCQ